MHSTFSGRRKLLQMCGAAPFLFTGPQCLNSSRPNLTGSNVNIERQVNWRMPEEGDPHKRTWMAFGASQKVWGKRLLEPVRQNLALIAQTIAKYEPVVLCVRKSEVKVAKSLFKTLKNIDWFETELDDLWIRDYGAVFVTNDKKETAAVDFNFNGWGEKQDYKRDAMVAGKMAKHSKAKILETEICLEGGGVEVDGQGTAIVTESCVVNRNRNPDWSRKDCEIELSKALGLRKIIWLPGVKGEDITDGHTDFYARFAKPGIVVAGLEQDRSSSDYRLTRRHLEILKNSTDANGRKLEVVTLEAPHRVRSTYETEDFCAGYINFYVCNDAVIATEFGDKKRDDAAKAKLADLFPERKIEMLNIDGIAAGGGGIHCATQQEPRAHSI